MQDSAYELISMGFRYWFVFLVILTLWRAVLIMRRDRRDYRHTMRQLPDAGLVGELVNLESGFSYPLAREGMIGSGRSCDIRIAGLRHREFEFYFRPGYGLRLIPVHQKGGAMLDGEMIKAASSFALHGTVLEARGIACRFRLFSGLDMPARALPEVQSQLSPDRPVEEWTADYLDELTLPVPPSPEMGMTWQYAAFPPNIEEPEVEMPAISIESRRRRRSQRWKTKNDE